MAEVLLAQVVDTLLALKVGEGLMPHLVDVGKAVAAHEVWTAAAIEAPLLYIRTMQAFLKERDGDLCVPPSEMHRPHRHALLPDDGLPRALVGVRCSEVEVYDSVVAPVVGDDLGAWKIVDSVLLHALGVAIGHRLKKCVLDASKLIGAHGSLASLESNLPCTI
jgi:hypothetical protein